MTDEDRKALIHLVRMHIRRLYEQRSFTEDGSPLEDGFWKERNRFDDILQRLRDTKETP